MKKDEIKSLNITQANCGDYHSVILTSEGHLFAWGGSVSHQMSKRKSRLYDSQLDSNFLKDVMSK
jgi:alpha-tubulin suppressor-like RCC1 family protein